MAKSKVSTPEEITVSQAAEILAVSSRQVRRYIHSGLLASRTISMPTSKRPSYRVLLDEVIRLKNERRRSGFTPKPKLKAPTPTAISAEDFELLPVREWVS